MGRRSSVESGIAQSGVRRSSVSRVDSKICEPRNSWDFADLNSVIFLKNGLFRKIPNVLEQSFPMFGMEQIGTEFTGKKDKMGQN